MNQLHKKVKPIKWTEISTMPGAGHWDRYPNCRYCDTEATLMASLNSFGFAPMCERHAKQRFSSVSFGLNVHNDRDIQDAIERERVILEKLERG